MDDNLGLELMHALQWGLVVVLTIRAAVKGYREVPARKRKTQKAG